MTTENREEGPSIEITQRVTADANPFGIQRIVTVTPSESGRWNGALIAKFNLFNDQTVTMEPVDRGDRTITCTVSLGTIKTLEQIVQLLKEGYLSPPTPSRDSHIHPDPTITMNHGER